MPTAITSSLRTTGVVAILLLALDLCVSSTAQADPESSIIWNASINVHALTGDEMNDAYGLLYGGLISGGQQITPNVGWRIESGLMLGIGDPLFVEPVWGPVESSEMQTAVLPIGGSVLYQFSGADNSDAFVPYVGLGLEAFLGFERTSVTWGAGEPWNETKYRQTFSGHAIAGATFGLTGRVRGLMEIRFVLGADGSKVDYSFTEQEIAQGWLEAANAVGRPDFNFTGWTFCLGAQW
jgi:hypothetical protein